LADYIVNLSVGEQPETGGTALDWVASNGVDLAFEFNPRSGKFLVYTNY